MGERDEIGVAHCPKCNGDFIVTFRGQQVGKAVNTKAGVERLCGWLETAIEDIISHYNEGNKNEQV